MTQPTHTQQHAQTKTQPQASQNTQAQGNKLSGQLRQAEGHDAQKALLTPGSGRVTGTATDVLQATFGEPPWQVKSTRDPRTTDTMKVLQHEKRTIDNPPAWYDQNGPRTMCHYQRNNAMTWGGWPAGLGNYNGVYYLGWVDETKGEAHYFVVDYRAPTEKSKSQNTRDQLLAEGGGMTVQYGAYRSAQFLSGVVNFFNPADNIIQGVTGRNLNAFDDDFGKKLSGSERTMQFIQAAAEAYGAKGIGAMSRAERVALGVACVADAGTDAVVGSLEDMKLVDESGAALLRVIGKLAGVSGQFAKWRGGQELELLDYLGSLAALSGAGEHAIKGLMGQAGYDQYWKANAGHISIFITNADKVGGAVELVKLAGKFKK